MQVRQLELLELLQLLQGDEQITQVPVTSAK